MNQPKAKCNVCGHINPVTGDADDFGRIDITCEGCNTSLTATPINWAGDANMATKKTPAKKATPKGKAKTPAKKATAPKGKAKTPATPAGPRASTVYTQKKGNKSWVEHRSVASAFTALDLPMGAHQGFRKELKEKGELIFADSGITFRTRDHHAK